MATKFLNGGVVNGDLVVKGLTINIYADDKGQVSAPDIGDILVNTGIINGDIVFRNPSVNVYVDNIRQTATIQKGSVYDLDDVVMKALSE